ncbi:hypothetical protein VMCG_08294 [Cytospora schulzeri]|uniref:Acyltransferase 3 domain-containing protein n=1 Tax=Cytospora schulzeri TaxID=448051 RepID=A0A423VVE4_9PEZI|nr:hypothetical protein VMCG_08294 [Valsa malicola]
MFPWFYKWNGLRGVAAFLVVFHHSSLLWFSWEIHSGWVPGQPLWLVQLPIIRLFISGPPQVAIFFVVSGYAISHKPLKLARQGRFDEVGSTLASSFFRRHPRLFMPAVVVTFASAVITQLGWFAHEGFPGVAAPTREPPHAGNLWVQLLHVAWTEVAVTDPVGQEHVQGGVGRRILNPYDANLWTLPIEFNSSMVVFMFLAAFSRVHNRVRMVFAFALICYFQCIFVYWALFLFLGGMLICDLHFELEQWRSRAAERPLSDETTVAPMWDQAGQGWASRALRKVTGSRFPGQIPGLAFFVLALWLLSMPEMGRSAHEAAGFATIASLVPAKFGDDLVVPIGAVLLVFVVDRATHLHVLFTNPFSQYLGRISYSLYMVHGPLLWTLGYMQNRVQIAQLVSIMDSLEAFERARDLNLGSPITCNVFEAEILPLRVEPSIPLVWQGFTRSAVFFLDEHIVLKAQKQYHIPSVHFPGDRLLLELGLANFEGTQLERQVFTILQSSPHPNLEHEETAADYHHEPLNSVEVAQQDIGSAHQRLASCLHYILTGVDPDEQAREMGHRHHSQTERVQWREKVRRGEYAIAPGAEPIADILQGAWALRTKTSNEATSSAEVERKVRDSLGPIEDDGGLQPVNNVDYELLEERRRVWLEVQSMTDEELSARNEILKQIQPFLVPSAVVPVAGAGSLSELMSPIMLGLPIKSRRGQ